MSSSYNSLAEFTKSMLLLISSETVFKIITMLLTRSHCDFNGDESIDLGYEPSTMPNLFFADKAVVMIVSIDQNFQFH